MRRRIFRPRRRRKGPETYTQVGCRRCRNIWGDATCTNPLVEVTELLTMSTKRNTLSDTTELTNPSAKRIILDGMKFQLEYIHDPLETVNTGPCDPVPQATAFWLTIWEAIVLLPVNPGSTVVPAYIPQLSSTLNQSGDMADRVLWKRISHLPIWGVSVTNGVPQFEGTERDMGHGPVVVKTKCAIDDRHGLYLVQNYVHDIFGLGTANFLQCVADVATNPCAVPIQHDFWAKMFYHVR